MIDRNRFDAIRRKMLRSKSLMILRSFSIGAIGLAWACAPHIVALPIVKDSSRVANISVIRGKGFTGISGNDAFAVDGFEVAALANGSFVRFDITPGTHTVSVSHSSIAIQFEADSSYFFQIAHAFGEPSSIGIERLQPADAQRLMKGLSELKAK